MLLQGKLKGNVFVCVPGGGGCPSWIHPCSDCKCNERTDQGRGSGAETARVFSAEPLHTGRRARRRLAEPLPLAPIGSRRDAARDAARVKRAALLTVAEPSSLAL